MHLPRIWAEIDLKAITGNLDICRRLISPGCEVIGVVKADAYGHGVVPVASTLERSGIAMLGVGDSHEAIRLREAGIATPLLILGAVVDGEIPELIRHRVTPMVHSPDRIAVFEQAARRMGVTLPVHVLIDTGMSRLGVSPDRAVEHLAAVVASPHVELRGIGTHLAAPVIDPEFTREQLTRFDHVDRAARDVGIRLPMRHVLSSSAMESYPEYHFEAVRLGGLLYGLSPVTPPDGLCPALSLFTQVVHLRDLTAGTSVGYGGTYRTAAPTRIATIGVGYHDGYPHSLSNRAEVLVRGRRAPVVGRVTMDYVTIDVTSIPGVSVTDRVTLLGRDGAERISAADLATWSGSIPYEIPSHLGPRVRRFHHYGTATVSMPSLQSARTFVASRSS